MIKGRDYYDAQLVCDGDPARRYATHAGVVGLDLGPCTVAVVLDDGAFLETFCDGLDRNEAEVRRIGRKFDRQHRAGCPDCFDAQGRHRTGRCPWVRSTEARVTAGRLVEAYRRKAEHRRSLHGDLTNRVLGQGTTIHVEKLSKVAWQKMYGRSVGFRAPGMFETLLSRKAANAGGVVVLINPYTGRLSQRCVCGSVAKKPLFLRVHSCPCGMREQRDVWSAFLARHSSGQDPDLANARQELRRRQDVGGTPRSGGRTLRVPAALSAGPGGSRRSGWCRMSSNRRDTDLGSGSARGGSGIPVLQGREDVKSMRQDLRTTLGRVGVWSMQLRGAGRSAVRDAAAELDQLGWHAMWLPGLDGAGVLDDVDHLLTAAPAGRIVTGVLVVLCHDCQPSLG